MENCRDVNNERHVVKGISLKRIAACLAVVLVLSSMLIALGTFVINRSTAHVQAEFGANEQNSDPNALAMRSVTAHLGYGGMIHEF